MMCLNVFITWKNALRIPSFLHVEKACPISPNCCLEFSLRGQILLMCNDTHALCIQRECVYVCMCKNMYAMSYRYILYRF